MCLIKALQLKCIFTENRRSSTNEIYWKNKETTTTKETNTNINNVLFIYIVCRYANAGKITEVRDLW